MRVETRSVQQELAGSRAFNAPRTRYPSPAGPSGAIADEQPRESERITDEVVKAAAEAANKIASVFGTTVEFSVHEETGFEIIKIVDSRTDTVLREMPPHEILDMIARMWEAIGVFVDKTA